MLIDVWNGQPNLKESFLFKISGPLQQSLKLSNHGKSNDGSRWSFLVKFTRCTVFGRIFHFFFKGLIITPGLTSITYQL